VSLLQKCPDIQSITVDLRDWASDGYTWSPGVLCAALGGVTFPSLHTFRALGAVNTDWSSFFESPEENPLHAFFTRHPALHTIGVGCVHETETMYSEAIDTAELTKLFPSLVHLEAPAFLCDSIMASSLADQIESLVILGEWYGPTATNPDTMIQVARRMPKLQRLTVPGMQDAQGMGALKQLLSAAPELKELKYTGNNKNPVCTR
jgi:hypothetical protein